MLHGTLKDKDAGEEDLPPGGGPYQTKNHTSALEVIDGELHLFGKRVMELIERFGYNQNGESIAFKVYFPHIAGEQVQKMCLLFNEAINRILPGSNYTYSYPTKPNHSQILGREIFGNVGAHFESSSTYDVHLAKKYIATGVLPKDRHFIFNGPKTTEYITGIGELIKEGCENSTVVLDSKEELDDLEAIIRSDMNIGIRVATKEKGLSTSRSRLGISEEQIIPFVEQKIKDHPQFTLSMLHFFMNKGIKDTPEYYQALKEKVRIYTKLKSTCPTLESLNIGGGMPVDMKDGEIVDHKGIVEKILLSIKEVCDENNCPYPHILSEFGTYTVSETGYNIVPVLRVKDQGDGEKFMTLKGSPMGIMPDTQILGQSFPTYAVRYLERETEPYFVDGTTCDGADVSKTPLNLPIHRKGDEQFIVFSHTGAYQDNLNGGPYARNSHCMLGNGQTIYLDIHHQVIRIIGLQDTTQEMLKAGE